MAAKQPVVDVSPEELDAYLDLSNDDIARIVLCLLIEEALRGRLMAFRSLPESGTHRPAFPLATENRNVLVHPSSAEPMPAAV
jgi:hypothetical protein